MTFNDPIRVTYALCSSFINFESVVADARETRHVVLAFAVLEIKLEIIVVEMISPRRHWVRRRSH